MGIVCVVFYTVVQLVYFNIMPIHCFLQEKFPQYISAARGQGGFCAIDLPDTTARDSFVNQLRSSGKNYVKNHGLSWKGGGGSTASTLSYVR